MQFSGEFCDVWQRVNRREQLNNGLVAVVDRNRCRVSASVLFKDAAISFNCAVRGRAMQPLRRLRTGVCVCVVSSLRVILLV